MTELVGGRYQVLRTLGSGAMGVVWHALDTRLDREVALKELRVAEGIDRTEAVDRFLTEARAAAALSHSSIVTVHDVFAEDDRVLMSMELLRGHTLADVIRAQGGLGAGARPVMTHVADALATAHRAGIVHRDLKPDNIFLLPSGRVVVCDFGLARIGVGRGTQLGTIMGTAGYMAPEQLRGQDVGPPADVFAWGTVAYELVSGVGAFGDPAREDFTSLSYRIVHEHPPALHLPEDPAFVAVVAAALAKEPGDRFVDGGHLHQALVHPSPVGSPIAPGPTGRVAPVGSPPRQPVRGRSGPNVALLAGVVVAIAVVVLVAVLLMGGDGDGTGVTTADVETDDSVELPTTDAPQATTSVASRPTTVRTAPTTTPRTARPTGSFSTLTGSDYLDFDYPTGWEVEEIDAPAAGTSVLSTDVYETIGFDPLLVRVSVTPGFGQTPMAGARPVRDGLARRSSYREIAFDERTIDTRSGPIDIVYWEWTHTLVNDDGSTGAATHSVDIFFIDAAGNGIAMLTRAPIADFDLWRSTFDEVRSSIFLKSA